MKKIFFTLGWWSIGECSININIVLNYIKLLKEKFPNLFYFVFNLEGSEFVIRNCIPNLSNLCDEYHINNPMYFLESFESNSNVYQKINPYCYIYKSDFDKSVENIFTYESYVQPKIFLDLFDDRTHALMVLRHYVEILPDYQLVEEKSNSQLEIFIEFTDEQIKIRNQFLLEKNIENFDSLHFRCHSNDNQKSEREIINYWIERISPHIDPNKTYFLSSSNQLFYKIFEEKFKNCFYIDRGKYSYNTQTSNKELNFLPDNVRRHSNFKDINDYIAFLELSIICKSEKIIHSSDGYRDMISLFLWFPILKYQIPLLWIAFQNDVTRKYNLNGCYYQTSESIDKSKIPVPYSLCQYSNGQLC